MKVRLVPGRVFVGMALPSFIPESMIEAKLRPLGLGNFRWFKRGDLAPFPASLPRTDPLYTDDWTRFLAADYSGPARELEEKKIWSWMVIEPKIAG